MDLQLVSELKARFLVENRLSANGPTIGFRVSFMVKSQKPSCVLEIYVLKLEI
ncbi:hypothetical protein Hdeb2414_s0010g00354921 [Helianthus debilis subsp. tardiflorus]